MEIRNLSPEESALYFEMIGRPISASRVLTKTARVLIRMEKADRKRGEAYTKRVWAGNEKKLIDYLAANAKGCAAYALDAVTLGRDFRDISWTYRFPNPHGEKFPSLGYVHFRRPSETVLDCLPEKIAAGVNSKNSIAIESVELHPSLRRKGFFNLLINEIKMREFKLLALQHIANSSWGYHLYQKSKEPNSRIFLASSDETVAFDKKVSPMPSFVFWL